MKVLVTGGSGMVGRHVVRSLSRQHDVTSLDIRMFDEGVSSVVRVDVLDPQQSIDAVRGAEAVVHLAGIPHPLDHPAETVYRVNTLGTFNMLEACGRAGIKRFVFMSSESVLGFAFSRTANVPDFLPVDESHPLRPQDPYGLSKVSAELLCAGAASAYGMTVVSLRAPWIWAPDPERTAFYRSLVEGFRRWPKNLWAYIHVHDVCQAVASALTADMGNGFEAMFIAADEQWTDEPTMDLVHTFYPDVRLPSGPIPGNGALITSAKAHRLLGFRPRYTKKDLF